jgi:hypothetical protein
VSIHMLAVDQCTRGYTAPTFDKDIAVNARVYSYLPKGHWFIACLERADLNIRQLIKRCPINAHDFRQHGLQYSALIHKKSMPPRSTEAS